MFVCNLYVYMVKDYKVLSGDFSFSISTNIITGSCEYDDLVGYSLFTIFLVGAAVIAMDILGVAIIFYNIYVKNLFIHSLIII